MKVKQVIGVVLAVCLTSFSDAATHNVSTIAELRTALADDAVVAGDVIRLADGIYETGEPIAVAKAVTLLGSEAAVIPSTDAWGFHNTDIGACGVIVTNTGASGVFEVTAAATLSGLRVTGGVADHGAGVAFLSGAAGAKIENCVVDGNRATNTTASETSYMSGAGIFTEVVVSILSCIVSNNTSTGPGGAGICCKNNDATLVSNCVVTCNSLTRNKMRVAGVGRGTIKFCEITRNICSNGSGYTGSRAANAYNCIYAWNSGNAVVNEASHYDNCLFLGNDCGGSRVLDTGGVARNCTIVGNKTTAGAGNNTFYNCVIWGNTTSGGSPRNYAVFQNSSMMPSLSRSIIYPECLPDGGYWFNMKIATNTANRLKAWTEPIYADPMLDAHNVPARFSAAVDAADASKLYDTKDTSAVRELDLRGQPRVQGNGPDLGCYETAFTETRAAGGSYSVSDAASLASALEAAGEGSVVTLASGSYVMTNELVVSAGVTLRGATGDRADVILTRAPGEGGAAAGRVVTLNHTNAVLSGVTITGGDAPEADGGGVNIVSGTLTNCLVTANTARDGGGVYIGGGQLLACTMHTNLSLRDGGGVYTIGGNVRASDVTSNVSSNFGGGVYAFVPVRGLNLVGNNARSVTNPDNYSALQGGGGALLQYVGSDNQHIVCGMLLDCLVSNNYCRSSGGGVNSSAGGIVSNCLVTCNTAYMRGGGFNGCSSFDTILDNNKTESYNACGSVINAWGFIGGTHVRLVVTNHKNARQLFNADYNTCIFYNSLIIDNTTENAISEGCVFINSTITRNRANNADGGLKSSAVVKNSIVWGNTSSAGMCNYDASVKFTNSCYEADSSITLTTDPVNCITADPLLKASGMISGGSPCIDRGGGALTGEEFARLGPVDVFGNPRVRGAALDIGGCEYYPRNFLIMFQ